MAQINTRIIIRNDSSFNWVLNEEVVLLKGEFGVEFTTEGIAKVKIGDGVTAWKDLEYFGGEQFLSDNTSIIIEDKVIQLKGFKEAATNAQPRKTAEGTIEWVVPSTDTLDGLQVSVATLQSDVKDLQETIQILNSDDNVEGSVLKVVKDEINEFAARVSDDGTINTIKELIDYVGEHGKEVTSIISKLDTIEEGAQVNLLEGLTIAGAQIEVKDKVANIAIAGIESYGVVKSSTGTNKVNIANDGSMKVSKIDINSLVVPIGEELVLNGGSSSANKPNYASSIGNIGYASVEEAINNADNGDIITLQNDLDLSNANLEIEAENVTIDLNSQKITANGSNGAIKVSKGLTTLEGQGNIHSTLGADNFSMAIWAENGKVIINDGIYTNVTDGSKRGTDLIYASGTGVIEINGGTFEAAKPEWTLNIKDADYKAGTAKIIVKGGSFRNFDPANNNTEGAGTNYVALGYQSVKEGDYYVVKPL